MGWGERFTHLCGDIAVGSSFDLFKKKIWKFFPINSYPLFFETDPLGNNGHHHLP